MSTATPNPAGVPGPARVAEAADLAELLAAFNEVTSRLQSTHETLTSEVARLQGELRDANRRLRRAQELAALGEMAAGIAHEIRNPLGSIRLYARALEEDLAGAPEPRALAQKIGAAVRGLDAVVSDVLAFSREIRVEAKPAPASRLIERALCACADLIERASAQIDVPEPPEPVILACDEHLAQQALTNIVRNALEAVATVSGPRRVRVEASACPARGPEGAARPMAAVRVHDTGPGVPEGVMERMFNPFFTTRDAGTGLGLAIVHRIADAHDGRVTVRNGADGGAVVELVLPAARETRITHEPTRAGARAHGGEA